MANMLLSSYYDTAADIDLYELFYNGTGERKAVTDEEIAALVEICPWAAEVDVIRDSAVWMDAFLQEYAGVPLDATNKKNLDQFIYLKEYDAYLSALRRYKFPTLRGYLTRAERGRDHRAHL